MFESHIEHRQTLKDKQSLEYEAMDLCPLFASEAPKKIDFSPNMPQKIVAKATKSSMESKKL